MNKIIPIFIAAVIGGGALGLALNNLQGTDGDSFAAGQQLSANISQVMPISWNQTSTPDVRATSAILTEINAQGGKNVIWAKNAGQKSPIASLTKLMTAVIAVEFYKQDQNIIITKRAVDQMDQAGLLNPGESFGLEGLLKIMLVESSNDAAFALTELMGGPDGFVSLMNLKAYDLGLNSTYFFNPNGLDPEDTGSPAEQINYSTANDLVNLARYIVSEHPEIVEISGKKELAVYSDNGQFHHELQSTNELLGRIPGIIGGKTGTTARAGGCLLLIIKGKSPETYLVAVVLNSPDKFADMKRIIENYGL
ncbi:MAG: serine hydrolase [Candidatus Pacebacteria bacterium]|nr:serine hydrolase [Candidatus Paceibacterota bacterium]